MGLLSVHSTTTHYVIVITWCVALVCQGSQDFLFYSSLGDATHAPGLYGGPVNYKDNGMVGDMHMYGYDCIARGTDIRTGIIVDWFDIDESSEKLIFRLQDEDNRVTIAVGPICHREPYCRNETQDVKFYEFPLPQHKSMGPIAYYHGVIYFVYYDVEKPADVKTSKIQLRKLSGCKDLYPITSTSLFTIEDCSKLVATITEEDYEHYQKHRTLDSLYAYGSASSPSFLVQVLETKYENSRRSEVHAILTHISGSGQVKFLNRQRIHELKYFSYDLKQLGGVSVKDRKVCWAAIDRVMCADLDGSTLSLVREVLPTQDVAQGCQGRLYITPQYSSLIYSTQVECLLNA